MPRYDLAIIVLSYVLVRVPNVLIKHYDQNKGGEESYLAYTSTLPLIIGEASTGT